MTSAIRFESVSVTYDGADRPTLHGVELDIPEGELVLVVGETGCGKSTLLRCINGLVPHFTGGTLSGRVTIVGRDTRTNPPRELADVVGMVGQDPQAGFVAEIVEDELAYGMECLGIEPDTMRRRVEETLDLLGLADLRHRALTSLSGGQRQRVAIGAALTSHPRILVLDEPTSALDPGAAEEVLAALQRLVHDLGITVVMAEHRLERVVQYADQVLVVADGAVTTGLPAAMMAGAPVAPPVVELGRLAGWDPLPLSVRDARRAAGPLRARLRALPAPAEADQGTPTAVPEDPETGRVRVRSLTAGYRSVPVLRAVDLEVDPGEVLALMGRNGAGKSTLLTALAGMRGPDAGSILVGGADPRGLSGQALLRTVGLVPQEPADLLYATTVGRECGDADASAHAAVGTTAGVLSALAPGIDASMHPRDLSEGQRLALALAVVLAASPGVLLLDEPTRGLDYGAKRRLIEFLHTVRRAGGTVVMATHDVELVAAVASRVAVIADGEIVADGATGTVVRSSPLFAPQVAKILTPEPWLTVDQVAHALGEPG
ncbi:MAG: ATP-binding cassette domain-containing protein [Actinomycetota bacterium]|nr:ATP-binding cassette domain-containing protein [Actinomycetota bacterium]